MRTVMVSTAPPTVAVTVVVPTLAGVIKPSAEMDRTLASATAQVAAAVLVPAILCPVLVNFLHKFEKTKAG